MNFAKLFTKNYSKRELKHVNPIVDQILALEDKTAELSDEELRGKPTNLRKDISQASRLTACSPKHSPFAVRRHGACWG